MTEQLEQLGRRAADIYGQEWNALLVHSRAIWLEAVRNAEETAKAGSAGEGPLSRCAHQAWREYFASKNAIKSVPKETLAAKFKAVAEAAKEQVVKASAKTKDKNSAK